MERKLFVKLEQWKNKKKRKPLIIQGARQVGKTWIMKEFGARYYKDTIYINFFYRIKHLTDFHTHTIELLVLH